MRYLILTVLMCLVCGLVFLCEAWFGVSRIEMYVLIIISLLLGREK